MRRKFNTRNIIHISMFAALVSVSGYILIPLPFSPTPVTAQTLAVMLTGGLLPLKYSVLSILAFLMMGAIGLPVFSGGAAGLGIIMGKMGGYLIGFLAGAALISVLKGKNPGFLRLLAVYAAGGILTVYFGGVLWLNYVTKIGISKSIIVGALPFIPGDLLKITAAAFITLRLKKHIKLD